MTAPTERRESRWLVNLVETLVLTILIFLGIQTFVAQPYKVEGGSMETTLLPDEYVLVDKLTPRWDPYVRGDIVVLQPPGRRGATPFIKRVIGLPGDHVVLRNGKVFVNGVALDEDYVFVEGGVRQPTEPEFGQPSDWTVPADHLLVMGDHRQASSNSRTFGPVEIDHVIGRAWVRYWPLDSFGALPIPTYAAAIPAP